MQPLFFFKWTFPVNIHRLQSFIEDSVGFVVLSFPKDMLS